MTVDSYGNYTQRSSSPSEKPIVINGANYNRVDVDWPAALARGVRTRPWFIAACSATGLLLACIYLMLATPQYGVHAVVAPSDQLSSMMSGTSAITRGLGLRTGGLGGAGGDYFDEFARTLVSEPVANELVRKGWLKVIFAKSWDASCNCWRRGNLSYLVHGVTETVFQAPPWQPPSTDSLYLYMKKSISFAPVGETDMQEIDYSFEDAQIGQRFLAEAIAVADRLVRQRSADRAKAQKQYLLTEYQKNNELEFRSMAMTLIMEQERSLTMAAAPQMYSGRLVVPATATAKPTSPSIPMFVILGLVLGLVAGIVTAFLGVIRQVKREAAATGAAF